MNRLFMMMLALAAFGLALGSGCKKDDEAKGEVAAKPAEATEGDKDKDKEEPAKEEEKKDEAGEDGDEAKGKEAAEGGDKAADGDAVTTGVKECDDLIAAYAKCDKLPQAARDAFATTAKAWKVTAAAGGDAKATLAATCTTIAESSKVAMKAVGCE